MLQAAHYATLSRLAGKPLPVDKVLAILEQVAQALDYAHQQKIIHRDLKPEMLLPTMIKAWCSRIANALMKRIEHSSEQRNLDIDKNPVPLLSGPTGNCDLSTLYLNA